MGEADTEDSGEEKDEGTSAKEEVAKNSQATASTGPKIVKPVARSTVSKLQQSAIFNSPANRPRLDENEKKGNTGKKPGGNIVKNIKTFIKKPETPNKETLQEKQKRKEAELQQKEERRRMLIEENNAKKQKQLEEKKRMREEREKRLAEAQSRRNEDEERRKRIIEQKTQQMNKQGEIKKKKKELEERLKQKAWWKHS